MVTKRSGQAQTALISRRPATVERTRRRQHPERIRATTNQVRIGDPVIRTRIRRQSESNLLAAWGLQARWVAREPFLSPRPLGTKPQQINRLPNRKPRRQLRSRHHPTSSLVARALLARSRAAPIPDAGEGSGHKRGRNQRRGASGGSPGERQSQFVRLECRRQVMVAKAFPPHDGPVCRPPNPTGQSERLSPSSPL